MGKINCETCKKKCTGNALRVQDKYFHEECFKCTVCSTSLASGGFFLKDGSYYCTNDYQKAFGTKCASCGDYVEGEVVSALGNTYHQDCFFCGRCRQPFPAGEKVSFTGHEYLCSKCIQIPEVMIQAKDEDVKKKTNENEEPSVDSGQKCAGCEQELIEGQALIALEKPWHICCFKCTACDGVLHGEYMGKDGLPYCEKDYQKLFGVRCVHCDLYITGKVLQAGNDHHFHPSCARCSKCGDPFGDGEEMYMQGGAIWHPSCGPAPEETLADNYINGQTKEEYVVDGQVLKHAVGRSYSSSTSRSSSASPHGSLTRKYGHKRMGSYPEKENLLSKDLNHVYTISYLTAEPTQGYLRRPVQPYPPKSPQFHRPPDHIVKRTTVFRTPVSRQGMSFLVESIQASVPRPRSPYMNNEEPIEMSHYPGAQRPKPTEVARIERDDFPAPPFPYADSECKRRWSGSSKDFEVDENQDVKEKEEERVKEDPRLKKEEEELSKIASGIGKVFLKTVQEREKMRAWKMNHIDPRSASRTPSASREVPIKLRYDSPVNASPSRAMDRPRPWEEEEFDRGSSNRSSLGKSGRVTPTYNVVSSLRIAPKPGYGFATKSATLPVGGRDYGTGDITFGKLMNIQNADFSSARSDVSGTSEQDEQALNHNSDGVSRSTPISDVCGGFHYASYGPHWRSSMPNVNFHLSNEPPKLYPYHLLITSNYRLPPDVDRCHLEFCMESLCYSHLSNEEFHQIFHMSRLQFYRMPEWRRNYLKRRAKLF
ncbi:actin-binding LIM protein 3-like isoform X3 [Tachypleus tridentatus]|uniref:actin-binding LIM protein 3-like isoform X3 n=1 Tax=Tachypleus tridentatus TaxID=6853 RepID=UPI003FD0D8BA